MVSLSYGSASIACDEAFCNEDFDAPWADESNGLCGAGVPGLLELQVGTHTGSVPFRIELHSEEPPHDATWDEVVEVSFSTCKDEAYLTGLMGDQYAFPLPRGEYRVRYCARGFDSANDAEDPPDSYLVLFWPAPPAPGRIVTQTGTVAAYWHRARRTLTAEEQRDDKLAAAEELRVMALDRWGGRIPNERLRRTLDPGVGLSLSALSNLDIELEFALADAGDDVHRAVASWAALRCLEKAGMIGLAEIAPAVAALRRGDPAPQPFDDPVYCWELLERVKLARTSVPAPPDGEYEQSPQDWALTTLFHSSDSDSLVAAMETVVSLAFVSGRDGYREEFAAVREQLSQLKGGPAGR